MTSIEELFDIYAAVLLNVPWDDVDERRAFFCGFSACLKLMDAMAQDNRMTAKKGDVQLQGLHAEFERFAMRIDFEKSINH